MCRAAQQGARKSAGAPPSTPFESDQPGLTFVNTFIQNGASCKDIRLRMPQTKEDIERDDVKLVICMLNGIKKVDVTTFCETSAAAPETRIVLLHLKKSKKRPMLMIGEAAELRARSPGWDIMVNAMVIIARHHGVPSIAG